MRALGRLLALFVPLAFVSCGSTNENNYKLAAIGTGASIAMVGINRAITKDCWAHCSPGYLCNEENGLCELGECLPGCEYGSHCVRDVRGQHYCVRDMGGTTTRSTLTISPTQSAVPAADAGVADAALAGSADAATDASATLP